MSPTSYFRRIADYTFEPTIHAEGAWSQEDYHFSSLGGLCVHVLEQDRVSRGRADMQLSRISYDILGRLPFGPVDVAVEVLRPGRTIELVQVTVSAAGRDLISARAWYLVVGDTSSVAAVDTPPLPAPADCSERDLASTWPGGLIAQMHAREVVPHRPGRGAVWVTSDNQLVEGEGPIQVAEFCARIDVANGVAFREEPGAWAFPNVDLTVHLFRQPEGDYTGLDTTVSWGPTGVGLTSTVLHDIRGAVGRAEQSLTLRPL